MSEHESIFYGKAGTWIYYNPNLSGNVYLKNGYGDCFELEGSEMLEFIVEYIKIKKILNIENADNDSILLSL